MSELTKIIAKMNHLEAIREEILSLFLDQQVNNIAKGMIPTLDQHFFGELRLGKDEVIEHVKRLPGIGESIMKSLCKYEELIGESHSNILMMINF